jgi:LemA protein
MLIAIIVIVVLVVIVGGFLWATYNGLVSKRLSVENSWSQIEVQLKRRHDLIPNLVETVKGYASHENTTFENVTAARAAAVSAQGPEKQAQAEQALTGALGRLMAVAENYPTLRATENFQELQAQLSSTEDGIAISRRVYNDTVQTYNTSTQVFPSVIVARMFNFTAKPFFDAPEEDEAVPQVSFSTAAATPAPAAPANPATPAPPASPES